MSSITISKRFTYINYINLLFKNLTCSVTMSFSSIRDLINNSMFEKMRNSNKIFFNENSFSLQIFKNINRDRIIKHINIIFNNVLLFLKDLHSLEVYHNNITTDALYYKKIDDYDYFFYVGKFDNISSNIDNLNSMIKGNMLKYYNSHDIYNYKDYIGTYKFDLYCLICTIKKLCKEFNINIDDENIIYIKSKLDKLYNLYITNTNEDFQYDKLIEQDYINYITDSDYISGEDNTFVIDNLLPNLSNNSSNNNSNSNNMYLITSMLNIKDDSVIFEATSINKDANNEDNLDNNYSNLIIKYCTKHELSFVKKIINNGINNDILNITNKYYVMRLYKEISDDQLYNDHIKIINDVLSYLYKLHNIGIIHNDIKLNNIMYDNINNKYVLIDYGLSTFYNNNDLRILESGVYEEYFTELTKHIFNNIDSIDINICTKLADIILLLSIFKFKIHDDEFKAYINKLLSYNDVPNNLSEHLYKYEE